MAKPEWGQKRTCPTCGAKFYDLRRETFACPVCQSAFDAERLPKPKRAAPVREEKATPSARRAVADVVDDTDTVEDDVAPDEVSDLEDGEEDGAETEEGDLIEDTSDLGEDDDDIGEVMEHLDDEDDKA